jgi:DNA-binding MarR family transcriptional regulator
MGVILTEDEKRLLRRLVAALRPFQELNERGVSLSIVLAFLSAATKDGLTLGEHAESIGLKPSLASKVFADIGSVNRWHEEGFNLIQTTTNIMDRRTGTINLTTIGQAIAGRVVKALAQ